jgi:ABC-type multidrug transport system fused ATPase/permease subunit
MRLIGFVLGDIPRAVVGSERVQDVLTESVRLEPPSHTHDLPPGPLGLSVERVSFGYDENPVLRELSFDVAPNESVALVGPTGSGKSTLTELLVRLADPSSGSIRLGGVDLRRVDPAAMRAAAAIVFQESFLFATTVRENISLGLDASEAEIEKAAELAQADRFIRALPHGLDTVLGERGVTLSGGQRQRVAIARALIRRPRLLILDDATSAVDPTVEASILNRLRDGLEATLIVVAYRVSTISLADRVLFLDEGRIAASGSHDSLLRTHPEYGAMVRAYELGAA